MSDIVDSGQLEIATDEHDLGWGPLSALPGHPLVWVLIASELAVFGLALLGYAGARARDPLGFAAAQDSLDRLAGAINTAILLTSGLFAALANAAAQEGRRGRARACLAGAGALGAKVDARIAALKPGFYTRLGAAMRHASFRLGKRPNARKLLLVITDGKPNDLDYYEGRFGVEDTRRAAQEARRRGQAVFCVAIDAQAQSYLPHLFGPAGFAIVSKPEKLSSALPAIYRHLLG